jgi:hypothetical protein
MVTVHLVNPRLMKTCSFRDGIRIGNNYRYLITIPF